MTAKTRRQLAMLVVAVVVMFAVVRLTRDVPPPAGSVATPSNPARGGLAPAGQPGRPEGLVADVQLERLTAPRGELTAAQRNPFRFQVREAPAPVRSVRPPPVVTAPPVPTGPPPPPPIALKFMGIIDGPTRIGRVAMLSDSRGNVFYGKEGDIIEGRYRVVNIGTESVELAYADGRGRQTIRLSGQ